MHGLKLRFFFAFQKCYNKRQLIVKTYNHYLINNHINLFIYEHKINFFILKVFGLPSSFSIVGFCHWAKVQHKGTMV